MTQIPVMLAKELLIGMILKNDQSKFAVPPKGWLASEKFDGYRALFLYEIINGKIIASEILETINKTGKLEDDVKKKLIEIIGKQKKGE